MCQGIQPRMVRKPNLKFTVACLHWVILHQCFSYLEGKVLIECPAVYVDNLGTARTRCFVSAIFELGHQTGMDSVSGFRWDVQLVHHCNRFDFCLAKLPSPMMWMWHCEIDLKK
jgi:hypothetical protein